MLYMLIASAGFVPLAGFVGECMIPSILTLVLARVDAIVL